MFHGLSPLCTSNSLFLKLDEVLIAVQKNPWIQSLNRHTETPNLIITLISDMLGNKPLSCQPVNLSVLIEKGLSSLHPCARAR
jgi:hypothetical protein